jgi:hypothetical protein
MKIGSTAPHYLRFDTKPFRDALAAFSKRLRKKLLDSRRTVNKWTGSDYKRIDFVGFDSLQSVWKDDSMPKIGEPYNGLVLTQITITCDEAQRWLVHCSYEKPNIDMPYLLHTGDQP